MTQTAPAHARELNPTPSPPMRGEPPGNTSVMDDIARNALFDLAPIAYSVLDENGVQVAANRRFRELFGYPPETVMTAADLTHPEDRERTAEFLRSLLDRREPAASIEKRYVRADGSVFWGRLTASVIDTDVGLRLLGVIEDIQPEHDLLEHLAEEVERRSTFVSQVSHEFRNPLHLIRGTSELLANGPVPSTQRQQARSILREATSLTRLVDDLLDVGRNDAGTLAVRNEALSLPALVDRLRSAVLDQALTKGIGIDFRIDDGCAAIVAGDGDRLHQILLNLATNAIKFTTSGSVDVEVAPVDDDFIRFRVTDTGPGIPPDALDRIFQPFVRLHEGERGEGLGLAISRRIATLLGGTLTARNRAHIGAQFDLIVPLPAAKADGPTATQTSTEPGEDEPLRAQHSSVGAHILIVEDNVENQLLATAQLDALGYTSDIAPDGLGALERLGHRHYDAVLMDWHLPGMDGLETTRRIRALESAEKGKRTPIIAVTARAMSSDIQACFAAGVDDHIGKPASLGVIRSTLDQWLSGDDLNEDPTLSSPAPVDEALGAEHRSELAEILDRRALEELVGDLGGADTARTIVTTYLDQLDHRLETIRDGPSAESVENAAHVLGSTSAMVGATAMKNLARSIETSVRLGLPLDDSERAALLTTATATADQLREHIERLIGPA